MQGYNAQAVVDDGQIVLAAEITNGTVDWSQLAPMVAATMAELARGRREQPDRDRSRAMSQYWNEQHMDEVIANEHIRCLIPPDGWQPAASSAAGWTGRPLHVDAIRPAQRTRSSGCTENANRRSSRYSVTPNTTGVSTGFTDEDEPPCAPSGDY